MTGLANLRPGSVTTKGLEIILGNQKLGAKFEHRFL
jgi:hypothetical protein